MDLIKNLVANFAQGNWPQNDPTLCFSSDVWQGFSAWQRYYLLKYPTLFIYTKGKNYGVGIPGQHDLIKVFEEFLDGVLSHERKARSKITQTVERIRSLIEEGKEGSKEFLKNFRKSMGDFAARDMFTKLSYQNKQQLCVQNGVSEQEYERYIKQPIINLQTRIDERLHGQIDKNALMGNPDKRVSETKLIIKDEMTRLAETYAARWPHIREAILDIVRVPCLFGIYNKNFNKRNGDTKALRDHKDELTGIPLTPAAITRRQHRHIRSMQQQNADRLAQTKVQQEEQAEAEVQEQKRAQAQAAAAAAAEAEHEANAARQRRLAALPEHSIFTKADVHSRYHYVPLHQRGERPGEGMSAWLQRQRQADEKYRRENPDEVRRDEDELLRRADEEAKPKDDNDVSSGVVDDPMGSQHHGHLLDDSLHLSDLSDDQSSDDASLHLSDHSDGPPPDDASLHLSDGSDGLASDYN